MQASVTPTQAATASKARRTWFVVLTIVFGLAAGLLLFGLVGLVFGWFATGDEQIHRVHDIVASGVFTGIFVSIAFLLQARAPERKIAASQQVAVTLLAGLIASAMAGDGVSVFFVVIVAVPLAILLALHPARSDFARPGQALRPITAAFALIGAIPFTAFALTMAALQRNGIAGDPHVDEHHWWGMAAAALAIPLVGLLASLGTRGWRIPAWSAAAGAVVFGLASAVFLHYPGSAGRTWGIFAIAGGLLFVAVAEWEARKPAAETG